MPKVIMERERTMEVVKPKEYTQRETCRSCDSSMDDVLELGDIAVPQWKKTLQKTVEAPLTLCHCDNCSLVQLRHTVKPELLWNENYGYRSGVNETMRNHLAGLVEDVRGRIDLQEGDVVVDIGSNDGTTLSNYPDELRIVGFDPSRNMIPHFLDNTEGRPVGNRHMIIDFFNKEAYRRTHGGEKAKVVTAISMFYDLEDPNEFVEDVKEVLDEEGIFVVQQNYVGGMIENLAFDNIVHEHLEYYGMESMQGLLSQHQMEIFDVEFNQLNGGSFRTFIRHQGTGGEISDSVDHALFAERQSGLTSRETYIDFAEGVKQNGSQVIGHVRELHERGDSVYIYGASTRGNTIIQAWDLTQFIDGAAERNEEKWGKQTVTGIPMVSEEEARGKADHFLVLPWFFKDEFVKREQEFIQSGGKLIFPLPEFEVIGGGSK